MIVAEVVSIAVRVMFQTHQYTFGGEYFQQNDGGPIGLRGTCAVARVVMAMFDGVWTNKVGLVGLIVWLYMRYMDDGRMILPSIKAGWRWVKGELLFTKVWEEE